MQNHDESFQQIIGSVEYTVGIRWNESTKLVSYREMETWDFRPNFFVGAGRLEMGNRVKSQSDKKQ